jgi:hypothetical protein
VGILEYAARRLVALLGVVYRPALIRGRDMHGKGWEIPGIALHCVDGEGHRFNVSPHAARGAIAGVGMVDIATIETRAGKMNMAAPNPETARSLSIRSS